MGKGCGDRCGDKLANFARIGLPSSTCSVFLFWQPDGGSQPQDCFLDQRAEDAKQRPSDGNQGDQVWLAE